jgi:hypothetical protein
MKLILIEFFLFLFKLNLGYLTIFISIKISSIIIKIIEFYTKNGDYLFFLKNMKKKNEKQKN